LIGRKSVGQAESHRLDYKQPSGLVESRSPDELAAGKCWANSEIEANYAHSLGAPKTCKSRPKRGQNSSREGNRGRLNSNFSGFIHFPTNRTLSGWTLLFAMGKHTSKEFLYDREHSRISKCGKTRSKTGSKTGLKGGPSQHPKSKKHRYTGKYSNGRTPKKRAKNEVQSTQKSARELCQNHLPMRLRSMQAFV
jgi:hypothetical protein